MSQPVQADTGGGECGCIPDTKAPLDETSNVYERLPLMVSGYGEGLNKF